MTYGKQGIWVLDEAKRTASGGYKYGDWVLFRAISGYGWWAHHTAGEAPSAYGNTPEEAIANARHKATRLELDEVMEKGGAA